jgi:hypothetical protein
MIYFVLYFKLGEFEYVSQSDLPESTGINPLGLAKRNALGMFIAAVVSMLLLVFK